MKRRDALPVFAFLKVFVFDIFHDVPNLTVENFAKCVDGMCADAFISFQAGDLRRTDVVLFDQCILRNALLFHDIPEVFIGNHNIQASLPIVVTAYDYVTNQEKYHIDLINNTAVKWAVEIGNAEFGEKNILAFSFTGMGAANNGETYRCAINIQNNSDSFITVLSANVIFLDTDGNYLDETTTYEREVSANTSVEQERYTYMDETRLSKLAKLALHPILIGSKNQMKTAIKAIRLTCLI